MGKIVQIELHHVLSGMPLGNKVSFYNEDIDDELADDGVFSQKAIVLVAAEGKKPSRSFVFDVSVDEDTGVIYLEMDFNRYGVDHDAKYDFLLDLGVGFTVI